MALWSGLGSIGRPGEDVLQEGDKREKTECRRTRRPRIVGRGGRGGKGERLLDGHP